MRIYLEHVLTPLHNVLEISAKNTLFGLQSLDELTKLGDPHDLENNEGFFIFNVSERIESLEVKKNNYRNWLIRKGIEDLIKGINLTLIEAYWFCSIVKSGGRIMTLKEFDQLSKESRKRAHRLGMPHLLSQLKANGCLLDSLTYEENILSLNKVRNCLVHRDSLVSEQDINETGIESFEISYRRMTLKHIIDGAEEEITKPFKNVGQNITFTIDERIKTFKVNDRLSFNFRDFNDFVFTCSIFGNDLISKLAK